MTHSNNTIQMTDDEIKHEALMMMFKKCRADQWDYDDVIARCSDGVWIAELDIKPWLNEVSWKGWKKLEE